MRSSECLDDKCDISKQSNSATSINSVLGFIDVAELVQI